MDRTIEPNKDRALTALLSSRSITAAAEKAGVSERSIYTWLREDIEFRTAYQDMRRASLQAASEKIAGSIDEAVSTLSEIMTDNTEKANARVSAAKAILDNFFRVSELVDFDERLSEIERQINEGRNKGQA